MSAYDLLPCTNDRHPDCGIAHKRLANEARVVRSVIRALKKDGWAPALVNDGGDELIEVRNETEAMDAAFAVDESAIGFDKEGAHHSFMVVLGNAEDGTEAIADWTFTDGDPDGFNASMERITNKLWGLEPEGECERSEQEG